MTLALAGLLAGSAPPWRIPISWAWSRLLGLCAVGGLVYGVLGALLGVVSLAELRFLMRRQPGVRPADPAEPP